MQTRGLQRSVAKQGSFTGQGQSFQAANTTPGTVLPPASCTGQDRCSKCVDQGSGLKL